MSYPLIAIDEINSISFKIHHAKDEILMDSSTILAWRGYEILTAIFTNFKHWQTIKNPIHAYLADELLCFITDKQVR